MGKGTKKRQQIKDMPLTGGRLRLEEHLYFEHQESKKSRAPSQPHLVEIQYSYFLEMRMHKALRVNFCEANKQM